MHLKVKERATSDRLPLPTAIVWILLSVLFVTGTMTLAWLYYLHLINLRGKDEIYTVNMVIQKNAGARLPSSYLIETLDLSSDKPINLYRLDILEAKQKLLASPLIKSVEIKKVKPTTLFIHYTSREPELLIADYMNVAIDREGYLLPFYSFHSEKQLPSVYLGLPDFETEGGGEWNVPLQKELVNYAFECTEEWKNTIDLTSVSLMIDVSKVFSPGYGQREIVIKMVYPLGNQHLIRADCSKHSLAIKEYMRLLRYIEDTGKYKQESLIVDLRIPQLAYISVFEPRKGK